MKLNLGCGARRLDGYTNVDLRDDVADIVADASHLTFAEDNSVEAIVAEDVLEHFPVTRTQEVLGEWFRVLEHGGTLTVKVPNMHALAVQLVAYDQMAEDGDQRAESIVRMFIMNIFGGHRWGPDGAYDTHHTGFTPRTITATLQQAGFAVIGNDLALNMRVEAKKP